MYDLWNCQSIGKNQDVVSHVYHVGGRCQQVQEIVSRQYYSDIVIRMYEYSMTSNCDPFVLWEIVAIYDLGVWEQPVW